MEVLYWFESIRNPVLTAFMSAVTWLGHEVLPIAFICLIYWCINKKTAYKLAFAFFLSGLSIQALKVTFRIERPWVLDPNFKPVKSAIGAATGYSFPSGHTQAATSLYGTLALCLKKWWQRILLVLLVLVIGTSRMYLGVHTPLDVGVALAVSAVLSVAAFFIVDKIYDNHATDIAVTVVMALMSLGVMIYAIVLMNQGVVEFKNASDCCKTGGAGLGFAVGYLIERRFVGFDVKAKNIGFQILKFAVGIGVALGAKSLFKTIVGAIFEEGTLGIALGDALRYFILVLFIIAIYPAIFKAIGNKGAKADV